MRTSTAESNIAHEAALKIAEDFQKAGGKIKVLGVAIKGAIKKGTINKKTPKKDVK